MTSSTGRNRSTDILSLAVPIFALQATQVIMTLATAAIVGRVDVAKLNALGIASGFYGILSLAGVGLASAALPLISEAVGQNSRARASRWLRHSAALAVAAGLAGGLLCFFGEQLLGSFGVSTDLRAQAGGYLRGISLALVPFYAYVCFRSFSIALHQTAKIFKIVVAAAVFQLIALLIISKASTADDFLFYAGLVTSSTWWVMATTLWAYSKANPATRSLVNFGAAYSFKSFQKLLKFGIPMSARIMLSEAAPSVSLLLVANRPAAEVFVHVVAIRVSRAIAIFGLSFGAATTTLVARAMGAKELHRVSAIHFRATIMVLCVSTFLIFAWYIAPETVAGFFAEGPIGYQSTYSGVILFASIYVLADGCQSVTNAALTGLGRPTFALFGVVVGTWIIGLASAYIVIHWANASVTYLWVCLAVGAGSSAALGLTLLRLQLARSDSSQAAEKMRRRKLHV